MRLRYLLIAVFLLGLPVMYALESAHFNRTFQVRLLVLWSLLIGVVLGGLLARRFFHYAQDRLERLQITLMSIVAVAIVMPLLASLSNRILSFRPAQSIPVIFVEAEPYVSSRFGWLRTEPAKPAGYRTFVYRDEQLLRLLTPEALFPAAERGDTVLISVKKGLWGIEFLAKSWQ